ncbi:MAG: FlgD immunoglobulin-like domain containing protein [bacterium]
MQIRKIAVLIHGKSKFIREKRRKPFAFCRILLVFLMVFAWTNAMYALWPGVVAVDDSAAPGSVGKSGTTTPYVWITSNGTIVTFFSRNNPAAYGGLIAYSVSADSGSTWGSPRVTDLTTTLSARFDVAMDKQENFYIATVSQSEGDLHFTRLTKSGNNLWNHESKQVISKGVSGDGFPNLAVDSTQRLWLCYNDSACSLKMIYSDDGGSTWIHCADILTGYGCSLARSLMIVPCGQKYPWLFCRPVWNNHQYTVWDGNSWSNLHNEGKFRFLGSVVTTLNGDVHVMTTELVHQYFDGDTWSVPNDLGERNVTPDPKVALSTNGTDVWVIVPEFREGDSLYGNGNKPLHIMYNRWKSTSKQWEFPELQILATKDSNYGIWQTCINSAEMVPADFPFIPVIWPEHGEEYGNREGVRTLAFGKIQIPQGTTGIASNGSEFELPDLNTIKHNLTDDVLTGIKIYNARGQLARVINTYKTFTGLRGRESFTWDGKDNLGQSLSAGSYIYQIQYLRDKPKCGQILLRR